MTVKNIALSVSFAVCFFATLISASHHEEHCGYFEEYTTKCDCEKSIICEDIVFKPGRACTGVCIDDCYCKEGYARIRHNSICVPEEFCYLIYNQVPPEGLGCRKCGRNEIWYSCGPCDAYCNAGRDCPLDCSTPAGCGCIRGYVRNGDGECVSPEECPSDHGDYGGPGDHDDYGGPGDHD